MPRADSQPCRRDCPDRSPTCHAECEAYREFAARRAEIYRQRRIEYDAKSIQNDMVLRWKDSARRKRKNR